jgi:hypothetical protein
MRFVCTQFRRKYKEARAQTSGKGPEAGKQLDDVKVEPTQHMIPRNETNHAVVTRRPMRDVTVSSPPVSNPKVVAATSNTANRHKTEDFATVSNDTTDNSGSIVSEAELRSPWHTNAMPRSTAVPVYRPPQAGIPSAVPPPPPVTVESGIPGMHWALVPAAESDDPWERYGAVSPRGDVHIDRRYDLFERAPSPRTARVSPSLGNPGMTSGRGSPRPSSPRGGLLAPIVSRPCSPRAFQQPHQHSGHTSPRSLPWVKSLFVSEYNSQGGKVPKQYDLYM